MKNELANKIIVITGASSGIGEKIARQVAEKGGRPVLLARSTKRLQQICHSINELYAANSVYYPLDVSNLQQVHVVFQQIKQDVGTVDILVNNAGFGIFESFIEADIHEIADMFAVNVLGVMACTKEVLPHMLKHNSGHIINIASIAGKLGTPKSSGYSATKHAVLGFTNTLRLELYSTNIHVSAVNPGPIKTNFFQIADRSGNYVKNVKKYMLESDDVAKRIVQLMIHPKREINLPRWMNIGSIFYSLFPTLGDRLICKFMNKK